MTLKSRALITIVFYLTTLPFAFADQKKILPSQLAFNSYQQSDLEEDSAFWDQSFDKKKPNNSSDENNELKKTTRRKKKKPAPPTSLWGFGLGIAPTTIQVKTNTNLYTLKGSNFVVKLSFDKPLRKYINLLAGASLLPSNGSQADSTLGYAKFEANYISFEANGRFSFFGTPLEGPWMGGGGSYLWINKGSSNVVASASITSRFIYQINVGYNARMSTDFLMFRADYYIHPEARSSNGDVKIDQMVFSVSYFY